MTEIGLERVETFFDGVLVSLVVYTFACFVSKNDNAVAIDLLIIFD